MRLLQTFVTDSDEQTISAGREIARLLPRVCIVLLIGELGAGKTTITKGIVEEIAEISRDEVTSPTFTLVHEYTPFLLHLDLYRLETEPEVLSIGFTDLLDRDALLLIEWGERFPALIPREHYEVRITADSASPDTRRLIQLFGPGSDRTN